MQSNNVKALLHYFRSFLIKLDRVYVSAIKIKYMRYNISQFPENIWASEKKDQLKKKRLTILVSNEYGFYW